MNYIRAFFSSYFLSCEKRFLFPCIKPDFGDENHVRDFLPF